jgi:hypothetical protein
LYSGGGIFYERPVIQLPVSEDIDRELLNNASVQKDTTGCGDNFAAGIITSIAEQKLQMKNKFDLAEACCFGIASGGYACFYPGRTYFEKEQDEKRKQVIKYYKLYKKQNRII